MRGADLEALAVLGQRARGAASARDARVAARRRSDAELVAAEAVGVAARADAPRRLRAEPRQQRVAGGVAEGVVVALEAVEVEQQRARGLAASPREAALEVAHQRAAVAEAGERVGRAPRARLGAQHADVLAEREDHAHERGDQQRGGGERRPRGR